MINNKSLAVAAGLGLLLSVMALDAPVPAWAADTTFHLTIKDHKFVPDVLEVPANTKFKLIVKNEDSTAEEFDSSKLHREKVIAAGKEGIINLGPLKPGTYNFVGEYHEKTAKGRLVAK